MFQNNDIVRVIKLLHPPEEYDVLEENTRPPIIGDIGFIVDIVQDEGEPEVYIVECDGEDGAGIWLGDFVAEELELVQKKPLDCEA